MSQTLDLLTKQEEVNALINQISQAFDLPIVEAH